MHLKNNDDLMVLYSETVFKLIQQFKLPQSFAIITAHNPEGVICNININNFHDADLRKFLSTKRQCTIGSEPTEDEFIRNTYPIIGCSPDMSHQEESYAIEAPKNRAYEIAEKFKQNAFFWVEKGQLSIVPVKLKGVDELSIGTFKSRII